MSAAEAWRAWIGRGETAEDEMASFPARAAAATFDAAADEAAGGFGPGTALPPLWHWFYFLAPAPTASLGVDGHPARGGFLPPIDLPRRMFAGARLTWRAPLRLGRAARRDSVIAAVEAKTGASGRLAFVTVRHTISQDGGVCIDEVQDIVYREAGTAAAPAAATATAPPPPADGRVETVTADPVLLFRFSALTFNAHRIHYDLPYAAGEEGYPGLVVHGPLTALLLARLAGRTAGRGLAAFRFRGLAPLFAGEPLRLAATPTGDGVDLEARGADGRLATRAEATLA